MASLRALLIAASLVSFAAGRSAWVPLIDDQTRESVGDIKWDIVQIFSKGDKAVTKSVVEAGGLETLRAVASSGGPKAAAVAAAFLEQCPDGVRTAERRRSRRESLRTADVAALAADAPPE